MKNFVKALWVVIAGLFIASCSDVSENSTKISLMVPNLVRAADGETGTCTVTVSGQNGFYYTASKTSGEVFEISVQADEYYSVTAKLVYTDGSRYSGTGYVFAKSGESNSVTVTVRQLASEGSALYEFTAEYNGTVVLGKDWAAGAIDASKISIKETYLKADNQTVEIITGDAADYSVSAIPSNSIGYVPVSIARKDNIQNVNTMYVPVYYDFAQNVSMTLSSSASKVEKGSVNSVAVSASLNNSSLMIYSEKDGDSKNYSAGGFTYQWYKNGAAIDGGTESSYTVDTSVTGSYDYKVKVSCADTWIASGTGSAESGIENITVYEGLSGDVSTTLNNITAASTYLLSDGATVSNASVSNPAEVNITSSSNATLTVSGAGPGITIGSSANVNILGSADTAITVTGGTADSCLKVNGSLSLSNVQVTENSSDNGAVYVSAGNLSLNNVSMSGNTKDIYLYSGTVNLNGTYTGGLYYDNSEAAAGQTRTINIGSGFEGKLTITLAQAWSGSTFITPSAGSLTDTQISYITVKDSTGGEYTLAANGTLTAKTGGSTGDGGTTTGTVYSDWVTLITAASEQASGTYNYSGDLTFDGNTLKISGTSQLVPAAASSISRADSKIGPMFNFNGTSSAYLGSTAYQTVLNGNSVSSSTQLISVMGAGTANITNVYFKNNTASTGPGGLYISDGSAVLTSCKFEGLSGSDIDAIKISSGVNVILNSCVFDANNYESGDIYNYAGTVKLTGTVGNIIICIDDCGTVSLENVSQTSGTKIYLNLESYSSSEPTISTSDGTSLSAYSIEAYKINDGTKTVYTISDTGVIGSAQN